MPNNQKCNHLRRLSRKISTRRGIQKMGKFNLKQFILNGYAENARRLEELNQTLQIIKRIEKNAVNLEKSQILDVIEKYTSALNLLDDYDHQCLKTRRQTINLCCNI